MAFFTKVSTGTRMTDCAFFEYINSPKGFCCEKGWMWEYIGMQKTGREWKQWLEDTQFSCVNFSIELTGDGTLIFENEEEFNRYFVGIGYDPLQYIVEEEKQTIYLYGNNFMHDEFLNGNTTIYEFNANTSNSHNLYGVSNSFFAGCTNLVDLSFPKTFRHFGLTQSQNEVFDGCENLSTISCSTFFLTSNSGQREGDLGYAINTFGTIITYI